MWTISAPKDPLRVPVKIAPWPVIQQCLPIEDHHDYLGKERPEHWKLDMRYERVHPKYRSNVGNRHERPRRIICIVMFSVAGKESSLSGAEMDEWCVWPVNLVSLRLMR